MQLLPLLCKQFYMTDSFGYTSPQEADSTVIPSLSRDLKALVMREIPRQARNDSKDFYRITLTQPKESVMAILRINSFHLAITIIFMLIIIFYYVSKREGIMKRYISVFVSLCFTVCGCCLAGELLFDDFDDYNPGAVTNNDGWITTGTAIETVSGVVSNAMPFSEPNSLELPWPSGGGGGPTNSEVVCFTEKTPIKL